MSTLKYSIVEKNKEMLIFLSGNLVDELELQVDINKKADDFIRKGIVECIIDLSEVTYMSSNGIGLLITLLTKFRNKGGDVQLINVSEQVKKLLLITKLNAIFDIK